MRYYHGYASTPKEMNQQATAGYIMMFVAGFFTFGIAWLFLIYMVVTDAREKLKRDRHRY